VPGFAWLTERMLGLSAKRRLPRWQKPFDGTSSERATGQDSRTVILWADTYNRHFEPDNLRAAMRVLTAAGYSVEVAAPESARALCCGRTYLSAGLVTEAAAEMARAADVLIPRIAEGATVVGLEPSCILTFRDEAPRLKDAGWTVETGKKVVLFEEFLAAEADAGNLNLTLAPIATNALLHGHCHQKAHDVMAPVQKVLALIPDLSVELIESSCCGMAGAFGYQAETYDVSKAMAEQSLSPAVRTAPEGALVVADGTSCRHQIADFGGREALHVARVLEMALDAATKEAVD